MLNTRAFADSLPRKAAVLHDWLEVYKAEFRGRMTLEVATFQYIRLTASFEEAYFAPYEDDDKFDLDSALERFTYIKDVDFAAALATYPLDRSLYLFYKEEEDCCIKIRTFLYAIELMARDVKMTFDDHIKIFPEILWSPMLAIAYRHLHIVPDFNIRAPFIEDTWFLGVYIYYRQVFDGKVIPDFEMIAKLECTVPCETDAIYLRKAEIDDEQTALMRECVAIILFAAYLRADPQKEHLELFPHHREQIKAAARYRATARKVFAKATCPDCAAVIMSKIPGYAKDYSYAPFHYIDHGRVLHETLGDESMRYFVGQVFEHIFSSPLKIEPIGPKLEMLKLASHVQASSR